MRNKKVVRLTESQLHNIIVESVSQILKEYGETPKGQYMLGRLAARQNARKGVGNLDSYNTSEAGKFAHSKDPNGELGWHFNAGVGDQGDYEWQKNPQSNHYNGQREKDIERAKRRINRGMEYHGLG